MKNQHVIVHHLFYLVGIQHPFSTQDMFDLQLSGYFLSWLHSISFCYSSPFITLLLFLWVNLCSFVTMNEEYVFVWWERIWGTLTFEVTVNCFNLYSTKIVMLAAVTRMSHTQIKKKKIFVVFQGSFCVQSVALILVVNGSVSVHKMQCLHW